MQNLISRFLENWIYRFLKNLIWQILKIWICRFMQNWISQILEVWICTNPDFEIFEIQFYINLQIQISSIWKITYSILLQ